MNLTEEQRGAVSARGNVLVAAGAGTGKTRTLVERCLSCLLHEKPPAGIDEILMVTFTEAAAAEMRGRIRERLEQEGRGKDSDWQEQLALFESAHFGTLHSFCLQLVREHFHQLGLDPQLAVSPEDETRLLAEETLDDLFRAHYAGTDAASQAVQSLVQVQGRGWDRPIRALVLRLHRYAQALPEPDQWLQAQLNLFRAETSSTWGSWWLESAIELSGDWLLSLERLAPDNEIAAACVRALRRAGRCPSGVEIAEMLSQINAARASCPRGKKGAWLDPLKRVLAETDFFSSLIRVPGGVDPLCEDWGWVREQMTALVQLCMEFAQRFAEAKRQLGVVDFNDLEQHSLRLLWDSKAGQPTDIARQWQKKLRFIFVDEYQDINAAQDRIIRALSREGREANRFLVGDVKQSIYRFRLANPRIFQAYAEQWGGGKACVLPLLENFRSKEGLLRFVNSVFGLLMKRDLGGIEYDSNAALRFGAPEDRTVLSAAANPTPAAELHLLLKNNADGPEEDDAEIAALSEILELRDADREALLVGLRLRELRAEQTPIWDIEARAFRPVEWKDMAVLLRSPANKVDSYAKEFGRLGIPVQVARPGFYQSAEISDLLSLLQLLDNPLQDLPLLAVLHSPLVGLDVNDLAEIRLAALKTRFWTALSRWYRGGPYESSVAAKGNGTVDKGRPIPSQAREKVGLFLERFSRWRRLVRQASLSKCLESVLAETHYGLRVLSQSRGPQRQANLQRLVALAQDFDKFQRQGLFRFLKFIDAQKDIHAEPEVAATMCENAVRVMSIHQSKGLEFPVVAVADLGKKFNLADLRAEIILDEHYGICPQVKPPHTGKRYPSLPFWLARRRQQREILGEELRLLYVAMTRARDRLILTGMIQENQFDKRWRPTNDPSREPILAAQCYSDWLGAWFSQHAGPEGRTAMKGRSALLDWSVHPPARLLDFEQAVETTTPPIAEGIDFQSDSWAEVRVRLAWQYPYLGVTRLPAKTSVSALRQQASFEQDDSTAPTIFEDPALQAGLLHTPRSGKMSAADIGSAHHQFLQLVSLDCVRTVGTLAAESRRMQQEGRMTAEQIAELDLDAIAAFWNGELGSHVLERKQFIKRELAFTVRFEADELGSLLSIGAREPMGDESVLVQGVADLVVLQPQEICLVDFKTDQIRRQELDLRVKAYTPQLRLYAAALSRIYQRPVKDSWLYFLNARQATRIGEIRSAPEGSGATPR